MSRDIIVVGDIAIVPLTRGFNAIIDACDVGLVEGRLWSALVSSRRNAVYACRMVDNGAMLLMHRVIIGAIKGDEVDHRDGDGLHNRRDNLRLCTRRQNTHNSPVRKDNRSGMKGAIWDGRSGKWRAEITINGRHIYLGLFSTPEEAHQAYAAAAILHFGEFARLS